MTIGTTSRFRPSMPPNLLPQTSMNQRWLRHFLRLGITRRLSVAKTIPPASRSSKPIDCRKGLRELANLRLSDLAIYLVLSGCDTALNESPGGCRTGSLFGIEKLLGCCPGAPMNAAPLALTDTPTRGLAIVRGKRRYHRRRAHRSLPAAVSGRGT